MAERLWVWTAPKGVRRDEGMLRLEGWTQYAPRRVPAMWMRIADLRKDELRDHNSGALGALEQYGPLYDVFDERPHEEATLCDPWRQAITRLDEVSFLWRKEEGGVWALPAAPIELAKGYHRLKVELARVVYDGVRLATRGLELVPEAQTLDAYLWLSAAESVRQRHRFKRCERCDGWFAVQRTDARFCSAVCRNKREEE